MSVQIVFFVSGTGRSPVRETIGKLPKEDRARFVEVAEEIERHGLECVRVQFRQLEGKLWEIKFKAPGGGFRVAYVVIEKDRMVWLHAFKKQKRKASRSDLELARRRMKEVLGS